MGPVCPTQSSFEIVQIIKREIAGGSSSSSSSSSSSIEGFAFYQKLLRYALNLGLLVKIQTPNCL